MKTVTKFFILAALLALTFGALGVTPAHAATLTVTNTNDSGAGSLRQVIADAAAGDTITFDASLSGQIIHLASNLALSKNVTIDGLALAAHIILSGDTNGEGTGDVRVFYNNDFSVTVTLKGLTITKGYAVNDWGGGIYSYGALTVIDCTFTDNTATYDGGGIASASSLTVTNSIFSNNAALTQGGGAISVGSSQPVTLTVTSSTFTSNSASTGGAIDASGSTTLVVSDSTFSGNTASVSGAINIAGSGTVTNSTFSNNSASVSYMGGGIGSSTALTVVNSTFSGNSAGQGGGIHNAASGTLTVINSTFSGNSASQGGGIFSWGTLNLSNSLLANTPSGGDCYSGNALNTNNHNIIEDGYYCGVYSGVDPMLGALANNGGPTQTMALLTGSPAIDAGDDAVCAAAPVNGLDQRGLSRPQGAHCDIGAYEANAILTFKSAGVQDGWVLESSETSKKGGTLNATATTLRLGDDATKKQYLGILSFSTGAALPDDAVITNVTLKVKKQGIAGGGNPVTTFQGFMVDVKKGFFGSAAALKASDFQAAGSKTVGPLKAAPVSNWYSLNLTPGSPYINKLTTASGLTQIRLRFKLDDNNNSTANYLSLYSGNVAAANQPQLIIEYYVP
jgi:predicted outer membrane repeat protein